MVMPNTRVRYVPGLIAGVVAGTVYQLTQWVYIFFQVGVTRTNAIYGSFAALPLFLVWLQLSWIIVLLGAEFSYALQNIEAYEHEADCRQVDPWQRQLTVLAVLQPLIKAFAAGKDPVTGEELIQHLALPGCLVSQALEDLLEARLIVKAQADGDHPAGYQPAFDINQMSIGRVISGLVRRGTGIPVLATSATLKALNADLEAIEQAVQNCPANRLLKDI
jgi:membrane protein